MIGRLGRPNLRLRLAVSAGVLTMLAIIVVGVAVWVAVALGLRSATDDELRNTAAAILAVGPELVDNGGFPGEEVPGEGVLEGIDRPNLPFIQIVDPAGDGFTGAPLPLTDGVVDVAAGASDEHVETIEFQGQTIRTLSLPLNDEATSGALRVGIDVTSTTEGLQRARTRSVVAGLLAGLLAAVTSWFAAGRLLAPVAAVAEAARRLRRNDELPERIVGEGPDELGSLVTSFNDLLDDLRASRDQQRRLVADVSHELRTPLTSLRVKIEFIQSQPDLSSEQRRTLIEGAVTDLSTLGDLVSELVELASEGASPERARLVDLAEIVETEVERFRATSGRTIELRTEASMVETRPKQVVRALSNLLVNADKYSPTDEPIDVRQQGARIDVRDRGDGIPVDERAQVFERFYRRDEHRSVDGTGLGLAIVASVARTNNGSVRVDDPDDGGPGTVMVLTVGPTASPEPS